MNFIETFKNLRIDSDIKQYEIAKELGISRKNYSMFETGYRNISLKKLDKLLLKYNLSLDYVLELNKEKNYENLKSIKNKKYAENLRVIRIKSKLTQKEMANSIGCSQQALSSYENGILLMPIETLKLFCIKNKVSADEVTGKYKPKKKKKKDKEKQDK